MRVSAINSGMTTLLNTSMELALKGISTLEESLKAGYTFRLGEYMNLIELVKYGVDNSASDIHITVEYHQFLE